MRNVLRLVLLLGISSQVHNIIKNVGVATIGPSLSPWTPTANSHAVATTLRFAVAMELTALVHISHYLGIFHAGTETPPMFQALTSTQALSDSRASGAIPSPTMAEHSLCRRVPITLLLDACKLVKDMSTRVLNMVDNVFVATQLQLDPSTPTRLIAV